MDSLASLISFFLEILIIAVVARSLFSWFDPSYRSPVGKILMDITEPIVGPIRKVMPRTGMFDLSPVAAIFLLIVVRQLITGSLT